MTAPPTSTLCGGDDIPPRGYRTPVRQPPPAVWKQSRTGRIAGTHRRLTVLALVCALGVLTGCGSATPVRPDRFYRLDPAPLTGPAGTPAPVILLVNDLGTRGFLGSRQILFRTRDEPLLTQRYEELLWEEPPTSALARTLVRALRAARVFQFVIVPAERARAHYVLSGELERFEHLPTDQPPRVAAALHLTLVRADDRRSMVSRTYSGEEPLDGATPDAMVAAFNRLSARLVAAAVHDLQSIQDRLTGPTSP